MGFLVDHFPVVFGRDGLIRPDSQRSDRSQIKVERLVAIHHVVVIVKVVRHSHGNGVVSIVVNRYLEDFRHRSQGEFEDGRIVADFVPTLEKGEAVLSCIGAIPGSATELLVV